MDCKCTQEERIRNLETGQAETKVYVKQILDDIKDIKDSVKVLAQVQPQKNENKLMQIVITELFKLAGMCITILGAIVGAMKIMGK